MPREVITVNGMHDLGGMQGFGRVEREPGEPVFHAEWEKRVFGVNRVCLARKVFNQDEARHGIERMPPRDYLAASYYERWLDRTLRLLADKGLVTADELERRIAEVAADPERAAIRRDDPELVSRMRRARTVRPDFRRAAPAPRFAVGDPVLTNHDHPAGHTRLPRYARGKRGTIGRVHGGFIFPDTNAHGLGEQPHVLYSVRFDATELWGSSAQSPAVVHLDLWEPYLQPVTVGAIP